MRGILYNLESNPKRLFLIDGLGAFLTAFFLFAILRTFSEYFGMPRGVLEVLSLIALAFCIYSISCYFFLTKKWKPYLIAIGIANLSYCCLTLGLMVYYYSQLTFLGLTYFSLEIAVVCGLVYFEMYVLNRS